MKDMKYILLTICLLGLPTSAVLADAGVENLHLFWQDGEIVLRTDVSGPFQFSHQIAKAEDGKPFRVLIDIFPAVHNLEQKSFVNLPPSIIQSIRTSQYSVEPEKIVRVVCDLKKESVYRIEKLGQSVFLYFPDKDNSNFPRWSSLGDDQKSTVKSVSEQAESKDSKSLVKAPKPEAKSAPPLEVSVGPESTYYKAQQSDMMEKEWSQAEPSGQPVGQKQGEKSKTEKPPVSTQYARSNTATEKADNKKVPSKPKIPVDKRDKSQKPVTPTGDEFKAPSTPMVLAPPGDNSPDQEKATASGEKQSKSEATSKKTAEVVSKPQKTEEKASKSTSRFRRQPTLPTRLKGTIVAEFPTRMVIKYKQSLSRDPFESLIGEKKGSEEFGQKKLLDIETARLVGILQSASGKNRALVEDLDGYGYILKQGDRIKKGYVSKIYSDKALFQLFEYGWSRAQALHLENN